MSNPGNAPVKRLTRHRVERMGGDARTLAELDIAAEGMLQLANLGEGILARMRDRQRTTARNHDVMWCDSHETPDCGCPLAYLQNGRTDPTGEAAILPDRARQDEHDFIRDARALLRIVDRMTENAATYEPRPPGSLERKRSTQEALNRNTAHCEHCAEAADLPPYTDLVTKKKTDCKGILPTKVWLCNFHYRFTLRNGKKATVKQTRQRLKGERVMVPVESKAS